MGSGSMQLARVFGIRIGVNASWFLVLFVFVFVLSDAFARALGGNETLAYVASVVASLSFFGSILLHELGHAVAARREGIEVSGIDLFFFGGLMRMNRDTDSPGAEFKVAVAGPAVTLAIVVVGALLGSALAGSFAGFMDLATLDAAGRASAAELLVAFLVSMNVLLLALNLVPAFPLDGGRIARALAWKITGSRVKATRVSAGLGQIFGLVMTSLGLVLAVRGFVVNGLWLLVLGWLLFSAARAAVVQTTVSEQLRTMLASDVMQRTVIALPADISLARAWDEYFLRYRDWQRFPVVDRDGRPVGLAERDAFSAAAAQLATSGRAGEEFDARRAGDLAKPVGPDGIVRSDASVESLIGSSGLTAAGLVLVVDASGRLEGVVTPVEVARALKAAAA